MLTRLTALAPGADDERDFRLREKPLPPPRTGATLRQPFPPAPTAPVPDAAPTGPLAVTRYAPEGEVPLAPQLSITFSQPMVAVAPHTDLAASDVPVRLRPQPQGEWRWVGTKTLLFEPRMRFPMATRYVAEIPAGTRSASGGELAEVERFEFSTPAPVLQQSHPQDVVTRMHPVMFASFDQRIDPQAVLATTRTEPSGALRLATKEEIDADPALKPLVAGATEGRWLAFVPVSPLPSDARIRVVMGPELPSAEGDRRTEQAQSFTFRTYGPLRVVQHVCGWGRNECRPEATWRVQLSNPLDAKTFRKEWIRVTPELPGLARGVSVSGDWLYVSAGFKGRTTYRVTLSAALTDAFGQTLGKDETLSFDVGPAERALRGLTGMHVLDPTTQPSFSVYTTNERQLRVRAYAVKPEDYSKFSEFMQQIYRRRPESPSAPGPVLLDRTLDVEDVEDEMVETRIDLAPALPSGLGHLIVTVERSDPPQDRDYPIVAWVQATQIGLDAFVDADRVVAWTTSLRDGKPLRDVRVGLGSGATETSASSGTDGVAVLQLGATRGGPLVARSGDDSALITSSGSWYDRSGWSLPRSTPEHRWFVFDDRQLYRPGETVKVKGWLRKIGSGPSGDVEPVAAGVAAGQQPIVYWLYDSRGNEILGGQVELNAFGGFDLTLDLPTTMNLGYGRIRLDGLGETHFHSFQVQEFRRPEFEVTSTAGEGPHLVGASTDVTVNAKYYAGGALPNADVTWTVTQTPGFYTPPNRDEFIFGAWVPWWEVRPFERPGEGESRIETFEARTDASGRHVLRVDFEKVNPPRPTQVRAEASVMDVNRQAWTAGAAMLVHPSTLYVGLRSERLFVQRGEKLRIDSIVTDIDGVAQAEESVKIRAERIDQQQVDGEWKEVAEDAQECTVTSALDPVRCELQPNEGGMWRVTAVVVDGQGRRNQTRILLWVAGGKLIPARNVAQEKVQLIPDRKEYRAGDTAEILVLAPFSPAEGMLTLRRSGLLRHERFPITGGSHTLRIPIEEAWTPNVHVQVDLVGEATRTRDDGEPDPKLPPRPAFATGAIDLSIPPYTRTLSLGVTPRDKELQPGGHTTLDVELRDAAGRPVSGEVAIVVVDEAVLALTGYELADPISIFYASRGADVSDHRSRSLVVLAAPEAGDQSKADMSSELRTGAALRAESASRSRPVPMALARAQLADTDGASQPQIRVRTDFAALALFAASVPTDASGRAQVPVKLPDNLTRYRIMVAAVDATNRAGKGETTLTARLPLMVRPSAPRFLNFGDRFELPVVLQNQTDREMSVDVAVRVSNLELTDGAGRRVVVPARDRVEVRFPTAARRAGTARFQIGATTGSFADAAEISLPVWTPATTEAFATYGQIDQGAITQPIALPSGVVTEYGGLELTTSSTALQALTDAVLYLVSYPFECAEQISSRVLAVAALKDVLGAFEAEGLPEPEAMVAAVNRDIEQLEGLQNPDGGFAFWRRGDRSWPYISIHAAQGLERARAKGFEVPQRVWALSERYLENVERNIPSDYSLEVRQSLRAYALYVRLRMGSRDVAKARALIREAGGVEELPIESLGWLLPVLTGQPSAQTEVEAIRRHLSNRATETAATASFAQSYGEQGPHLLLHSSRRTDAVLLEALIADQPQSDLIPKLVEGLLAQRVKGRWQNTQENAFVLLALDRYFATYENITPSFVARAWLGERLAAEQTFRGRSTDRQHVDVPMRFVNEVGEAPLVVAKEGPGRLYYRIGMQYAPSSLVLEPIDRGFVVERRYEAIDDPLDVRRDADGTWRIRAGAHVRVRLTMATESRRYHVALVDPLPAGLEPQNPALAVTGALPDDPVQTVDVIGARGLGGPRGSGFRRWWRRVWYEHQNLRDERMEVFSSLLWEGVYTYTYVARATTPGRFVVPPTKAEEMYHPETFGRAASDIVIVE